VPVVVHDVELTPKLSVIPAKAIDLKGHVSEVISALNRRKFNDKKRVGY